MGMKATIEIQVRDLGVLFDVLREALDDTAKSLKRYEERLDETDEKALKASDRVWYQNESDKMHRRVQSLERILEGF